MTNETETNEQSQIDAVASLDMSALRRAAKLLGITAQNTWTKENFIDAIKNKQTAQAEMTAVFDLNTGPAPGFARVIIHRDPSPNHRNGPIHLGVNGRIIAVPRGGEFDIAIPFVGALTNAKTTVTESSAESSRDNPGGIYRDQTRTSYPFQVLAINPGKFINIHDARAQKYAKRKAFFDKYGSWPTDGELKEYNKAAMNFEFSRE